MGKRAIFYDTETTGLKPDKDRIIEIAAFDPELNRTFCKFINPQIPIPEVSTKISGITDEMVKDGQTFAIVGKEFFEFCSGDVILIAHNNDRFDKIFLEEESKRSLIKMPNYKYIDTLLWAKKYRPDLPKHSLQYLREIYEIKANNAHRALDDVVILYNVFSLMTEDLTIDEIYDLIYTANNNAITQMPFGKHKGVPLDKIPKYYIKWLASSGALDKDMNKNLKDNIEKMGLLNEAD